MRCQFCCVFEGKQAHVHLFMTCSYVDIYTGHYWSIQLRFRCNVALKWKQIGSISYNKYRMGCISWIQHNIGSLASAVDTSQALHALQVSSASVRMRRYMICNPFFLYITFLHLLTLGLPCVASVVKIVIPHWSLMYSGTQGKGLDSDVIYSCGVCCCFCVTYVSSLCPLNRWYICIAWVNRYPITCIQEALTEPLAGAITRGILSWHKDSHTWN